MNTLLNTPFQHALMPLLRKREAQHRPINIGLLGCGSMGGDLLDQIRHLPGMKIVAIADRRPANIERQLRTAQYDLNAIKRCDTRSKAQDTLAQGHIVTTDNLDLIATLEGIEVVIDATGRPAVGAQHGLNALKHAKHLVMMNVESDVTIGALLAHEAHKNGVVYSLGAGDEPSSTLELVHFVENMGFRVIAAGKGKNNPLKRTVTPAELQHEAAQKKMNPRVLSEFIDGTKTMVEMTALGNATGFGIDTPGMHGQAIARDDLHKMLIPRTDGGILSRTGVIDYSTGQGVAPGVFVVAHIGSARLCARMDYLALGQGPYYTFYRPYHLTSLEVPISVARAALFGLADMTPRPRPVLEACGKAKRFIAQGSVLDGLAETCYYGWCMDFDAAQQQAAIPLGLLENGIAQRDIAPHELLDAHNVAPDHTSVLYNLRQQQEKLLT